MKEGQPQLTLYRGWLDPGKHVWSPFVTKLETRLRFAGLSYNTESGSVQKAPKGKIPYVEILRLDDGQPEQIGDSTLIIKDLVRRGVIPNINANLPAAVGAQDLAIRALLEEKLYFYHTWERWGQNHYTMRDHILQAVPYPMRVIIGYMIYRGTVKTLNGQGTGRYSAEEIASFRAEIWQSTNALLSASKFKSSDRLEEPFWVLGGPEPTEADTTVFGFITSVLICTACPDSQKLVKSYPAILEYAGRIHDKYFPDYEKCV
ncbi:hypothetical protein B0J14DRAFT_495535 [Halenospora varia]|nr:hypothetical protein B0J14DRAFT_495535 [Halenospora varia]